MTHDHLLVVDTGMSRWYGSSADGALPWTRTDPPLDQQMAFLLS